MSPMRPAGASIRRCRWRLTARAHGKIWLGVTLLATLNLACSLMPRAYDSTARTIRLREAPLRRPCHAGAEALTCVVLLERDWQALVIDYQAKCLQLGGSPEACQTVPAPAP